MNRLRWSDLPIELKTLVFGGLMDDPYAISAMSQIDRDFRRFVQKEGIDRASAVCTYVMTDVVANLCHVVNFNEEDGLWRMTPNNGIDLPLLSTCGSYAIRVPDKNVCEVFRLRIDTLGTMRSAMPLSTQKRLCNQWAHFGVVQVPMVGGDLLFGCVGDDARFTEMRRIARLAMPMVCGRVSSEAIAHQATVVAALM